METIRFPGPPWPLLKTSGRNALENTISKHHNLLIYSVKNGKHKGKTSLPGTISAVSLQQTTRPFVLKCKCVSNPLIFAWKSSTNDICNNNNSSSVNSKTDHLIVAGDKLAEIWTVIQADDSKEEAEENFHFPSVVQVHVPKDAGLISSVHWRPTQTAQMVQTMEFIIVTKQAAYVYLFFSEDGKVAVEGPISTLKVPVKGTASVCEMYDHSTIAFCGGGEFSVHAMENISKVETNAVKLARNQCLCVDLSSVKDNNDGNIQRNGVPRSLCSMSKTLSNKKKKRILFACLTDTPISLPFESGERDRPLNEAIHMMRTAARTKGKKGKKGKKDKTSEMKDNNKSSSSPPTPSAATATTITATTATTATSATLAVTTKNSQEEKTDMNKIPTSTIDLSPLLLLEKNKTSSSSSLIISQDNDVIDLVGGMLGGDGSSSSIDGNPGSTLNALMSISKSRNGLSGSSGSMLNVVKPKYGQQSSLQSSSLFNDRKVTPMLSVYSAYISTTSSIPTRIMRVNTSPIMLLHGDIMTCSPIHQLIAISSNTTNQVLIYEYRESEEKNNIGGGITVTLKETLKMTIDNSKTRLHETKTISTTTSKPMMKDMRVKGLSFQSTTKGNAVLLYVLTGIKTNSHSGFFSSGVSQYAVELRKFKIKSSSSTPPFTPEPTLPELISPDLILPKPPSPKPPTSPHPDDQPQTTPSSTVLSTTVSNKSKSSSNKNSNSLNTIESPNILNALMQFRNHIDARLDRIEGMLMMQSERLSRLESKNK